MSVRKADVLAWLWMLRGAWTASCDRLAGSDPGFNRLRLAGQAVTAIVLSIGVLYLMYRLGLLWQRDTTHAAMLPGGPAYGTRMFVLGCLLVGFLALLQSVTVTDIGLAGQTLSVIVIALAAWGAVAVGLLLSPYHWALLLSFPVLLILAALARYWGPRGTIIGVPLFIGDLVGYFLSSWLRPEQVAWVGFPVAVATVCSLLMRVTLFRPDSAASLQRALHSLRVRAQDVALAAQALMQPQVARDAAVWRTFCRRLTRSVDRLNESILIIDAHVVAEPPHTLARHLHERLFDVDLSMTNLARFAEALSGKELLPARRERMLHALGGLVRGAYGQVVSDVAKLAGRASEAAGFMSITHDDERKVLLGRFASSLLLAARSLEALEALGAQARRGRALLYKPSSALIGEWLPGSARVSAAASEQDYIYGRRHVAVPVWVRATVQVAVAVSLATSLGYLVSPQRFYWAVIAAFVCFIGANNRIEQIHRAFLRMAGTFIGILAGSLLVEVTGHRPLWSSLTVVVAMFLGIYLVRLSYFFIVVCITVVVVELYEQLGQLSEGLLALRLAETAVGAFAAMVTVMLILPLRTEKVLGVAIGQMLQASRAVIELVFTYLLNGPPADVIPISGTASEADQAYQAVITTARPLQRMGSQGRRTQRMVSACTGLRYHQEDVAWHAVRAEAVPAHCRERLAQAMTRMRASFDCMEAAFGAAGKRGAMVRAAALWNHLEQDVINLHRDTTRRDDAGMAAASALVLTLRGLQRVDGALAALALAIGMPVQAMDTGPQTRRRT